MKKPIKFAFIPILLLLAGCAASSSVKLGLLNSGTYESSTKAFTMELPENAKIFDDRHALGEYMIIQGLKGPVEIQGVSFNRVVNAEGINEKAKKDLIKSGHDFWKKTYTGQSLEVIHEEWTTVNGQLAYFTILEAPTSGFLVKPNVFYGTLSFLKEGYSYVLFDKVRTGKKLIGSNESPEEAGAVKRKQALESLYNTINFR